MWNIFAIDGHVLSIEIKLVHSFVFWWEFFTSLSGFPEIKKVDILWKDRPKLSKSYDSRGELYLRVSMSEEHGTRTSWNALMDGCLPIMDMIDWARSYPDNIHHFCSANGIDAGWKLFLNVRLPYYAFLGLYMGEFMGFVT